MINLQGISYDNLTFWYLNLSVALSRFIMNRQISNCAKIQKLETFYQKPVTSML